MWNSHALRIPINKHHGSVTVRLSGHKRAIFVAVRSNLCTAMTKLINGQNAKVHRWNVQSIGDNCVQFRTVIKNGSPMNSTCVSSLDQCSNPNFENRGCLQTEPQWPTDLSSSAPCAPNTTSNTCAALHLHSLQSHFPHPWHCCQEGGWPGLFFLHW